MAGNDFVMVQLSATGVALAEGIPRSVSNGRRAFVIEPGQPLRVERSYEWHTVLEQIHAADGQHLFELVADAQAEAEPSLEA